MAAPPATPSAPLWRRLRLNPPDVQMVTKLLVLVGRCVHGCCSSLLINLFSRRRSSYLTRGRDLDFLVPFVNSRAGALAPSYQGALLWNALPRELKSTAETPSFSLFKSKLLTYRAPC